MKADVNKLKKLHDQGRVHAHIAGPTSHEVLKLMATKPGIWHADIEPFADGTDYSILGIVALQNGSDHIDSTDLRNMINILGEHFFDAVAVKIKIGDLGTKEARMILVIW